MISAACLALMWIPSTTSAQSNLRDRVAGAIEAVQGACASDISNFCGSVTRGEGRVLLCMQAHEDQLSRRCQFALYRASRGLDRAINRVERIADACMNDIEAQCGDAERIGQCLVQKSGSLSQSCQMVLAGLRQAVQGLATLRGCRSTAPMTRTWARWSRSREDLTAKSSPSRSPWAGGSGLAIVW